MLLSRAWLTLNNKKISYDELKKLYSCLKTNVGVEARF